MLLLFFYPKGVKWLEQILNKTIQQQDERIRSLEIRMATNEQRMDTVATDVKEIKNTLTWLNRLVLGALVVQILSLVIGKV